MKINYDKALNILKIFTGVFLLSSVLYFIFGEVFSDKETFLKVGKSISYCDGWEMVNSNGTKTPIEVPGSYKVKRGDVFAIEKQIPEDFDGTWICVRSSQQDIKFLVDGEVINSYSTKGIRKFGKNSVSVFVFIELLPEYAGKTLRMEIVSHSTYSGYVNEIVCGEREQIWVSIVKKYLPVTILGLFMLLLSIMVVVYSIIIKYIYKRNMDIAYLGTGLLVASIWIIAESKLRQIFLPSSTIANDVGFMMVMLLPFPFLAYVNKVQKSRYVKAYMLVAVSAVINFIVSIALQFANIKDFSEIMGSSHVILVVLILIFIITCVLDIKKAKIKEYKEVAIGITGLVIAGLFEVYMVYDKFAIYNGVALCIGLVFLFFMAVIKTGKDLLEIEKERQIAVATSESRTMFLANMSHEIRTPINTIVGMNEMILRENQGNETREYAKNIESASKMLIGIIDDVLDFSKLDAGKIEICESPYSMAALLNDVILNVNVRLQDKGLKLNLDIDECIPSVLSGDEIRIKQIFNNLLSNAVKYTEEGYVSIKVTGFWNEGKYYIEFSVKDTGVGIREEDLPTLFDSFQRVDLKRNRFIQGTGLGLSITKQLVEIMDGNIEVNSEYNKGSSFTVKIHQEVVNDTPMGDISIAYTKIVNQNDDKVKIKFSPEATVLVVDDNEMNLLVMKALLGKTGLSLDYASSGMECYQMCKNKKYNLIFMDHMMPEPDGIETLHMIKEDKEGLNKDTKIIVLTANAIKGVSEIYEKEGFSDYISKPVDYDSLEKYLIKYLGNYMEGENRMKLDKEKGISYCGGLEELYKEILETYVEKGKQYAEELQKYYETEDWKEYARISHTLKSTSLTIGADDFSEIAKAHELAAKENNIGFIEESYKSFLEDLHHMLEIVENEL